MPKLFFMFFFIRLFVVNKWFAFPKIEGFIRYLKS